MIRAILGASLGGAVGLISSWAVILITLPDAHGKPAEVRYEHDAPIWIPRALSTPDRAQPSPRHR